MVSLKNAAKVIIFSLFSKFMAIFLDCIPNLWQYFRIVSIINAKSAVDLAFG
jgi:hypothetical protein